MRFTLALIGTLFVAADSAQAQPAPPPARTSAPERAGDEAAIRAIDEAFLKAFNAGEARALATTFTEDAEMIDEDGRLVEGRDAIAAQFAAFFEASPGARITLKTLSLKFLGPETAMVRGRAEVFSTGKGSAPEPSRYTVVFVKRDGQWLQANVRDEHDPEVPAAERLKALEWLIGEWVSETTEEVVHTTCAWSENKNFLLRSFTVQMQGKPALTGQQRIGWNPLTRQFKSWVFDSEGGFGEGDWSNDGDRWIIQAHGIRSDGRPASVTHVITRVNKDMLRWRAVNRTIGGRSAPDVDEFVLVRKPPKPR